jgi:LytS/YehU family sensor histidine kinase
MDVFQFLRADPTDAEGRSAVARRRRRQRVFWTFQAIFWMTIGIAMIGLTRAFRPDEPTPWSAIATRLAFGVIASTGIHGIVSALAARSSERKARWTIAAAVTGVAILVSVYIFADQFVGIIIPSGGTLVSASLIPRVVAAAVWYVVYLGLDLLEQSYEADLRAGEAERRLMASDLRIAQAEANARESELRHLQAQMNPHFLFNALNAVAASAHEPAAVEKVTQDLADYLRFTLREARALEPLARELQSLEKYLSVQQARFGSRLHCRLECDPASHAVAVPPMMLQPLLENAFVHGTPPEDGPLEVIVTSKVDGGWLDIEVANTGIWVPPDPSRTPSTGIRTLAKRLELLIGPDASVVTRAEKGWVRVTIRLPARSVAAEPLHA